MELSVPLPDDRAGPYPPHHHFRVLLLPKADPEKEESPGSANFVSGPTVPPLGQNGKGIFQDPLTTLVCILWG